MLSERESDKRESIGDTTCNYITNIDKDLFNQIVVNLPYKPVLNNLAMTSKDLQKRVFALPCGEKLAELNALQPSYLQAFFESENSIQAVIVGGICIGFVMGTYAGYNATILYDYLGEVGGTLLSTYLGAIFGSSFGGTISSVSGGYVIGGKDGAMNGIHLLVNLGNPLPYYKSVLKASLGLFDTVSFTSLSEKFIKESPKEIQGEKRKNIRKNLDIFHEMNKQRKKDQKMAINAIEEELSKPIVRKGV